MAHSTDDGSDGLGPTALRPAASIGRPPTQSFTVSVVEGPDAGRTFRIDATTPPRVLIGKGPACAIALTDPAVSRRHAALDVVAGRLRLCDLGSTNGTHVNGLAIVDVYLAGGERIRVGDTTLCTDRAAPSGASLPTAVRFGRLLGASPEMRRLYPICEKLAASHVPVIVEGETGTGKELLAESLHEASARASGPFVVFDCTTMTATLLESELFGHEKGSFTGAVSGRQGVFEQASGGTLFIDEIGDLELSLQSKLLRAIERGEVRRVGGSKWIRVDVRVIAATRRDLDLAVQERRFRDDLFYRLAVGRIEIPPLRRRQGDVRYLAEHFWTQLGGAGTPLPLDFVQRLEEYSWPGNARELHNAVAQKLALGDMVLLPTRRREVAAPATAPAVDASSDLFDRILASELPFPRARDVALAEFERRYVEHVLPKHDNNVARAAAASGIARRYFQLLKARSQKP